MSNFLSKIRYYLEIISLPAFVFLVIHLAGHGSMLFLHGAHEHAHHEDAGLSIAEVMEWFLRAEVLIGILFLILFTWLWHRPALKKWVPCAHEHCHTEKSRLHLFAIGAFCLHFFPEAGIRAELLHGALNGSITGIVGLVAFASHFLVDIIVAIILSTYWTTAKHIFMSLVFIVGIWFAALMTSAKLISSIPAVGESIIFLLSAFLLAMFIHKPHKPKICCDH